MKECSKALVLLNMGGARNKNELEMFLTNMFNDKNILTIKSDFFRSLIAKFIVKSRKDSAWKNYEAIGGRSPINPLTEKLLSKLNDELTDTCVVQVMRYTPPFAQEAIKELEKKKVKEVILFPMYPQYSTTTTKSSVEDFLFFAKRKFHIKVIEPFYKNRVFNEAIIDTIKNSVEKHEEYNLIFSAHGLPQKIVDSGDPYEKQINEHVEILSALLEEENIHFKSISLAYQSKVGPLKWLEPALDEELKKFRDQKVLIYPIAFLIDNSETDFELSIEYNEEAKKIGIEEYKVCKCLNDGENFIKAIKDIINVV
ncbi:ferrochelatase [Halarcobacter anaerophilus]|uniref:Ferrochelatase n=1 Tax=Halarcobacter anaerophilus TaxID=877500 RepID=A0A4Q0XUZ7_9BACT|nr:ferrochelatase [Halarcobacter anaerophilus]RXJ61397.1 ferrochelatase [Halarcobacter anaerophilus]